MSTATAAIWEPVSEKMPSSGTSQATKSSIKSIVVLHKLSKSGQYAARKAEHVKSSVRAKVEHVFGVVKKQLRFRKTRYRGLEKQQAKFNILFALANLILADRPCLAA